MKNFAIAAWFFVLGFFVSFLVLKEDDNKNYENYIVIPLDNYENGRQVFNVRHRDSLYKFVYAEEFANRLITGRWEFNEDLKITQ